MSFEINKPIINIKDTIQYLVTRPVENIVDDGTGNYNISPIGFPERNVSGELGVIPTRITPEFITTYNNLMGNFTVAYTSHKPISELYGVFSIVLNIETLSYNSGTVTVTSKYKHGYVSGATVMISGANELDYNGSFIVTIVDDYIFTYTLSTVPSLFTATGTIKSTYQLIDNTVIELVSQDDNKANGYYIITEYVWRDLFLVSKEAIIIESNIYSNINIVSEIAPLVTFNVASIVSETTGTSFYSASVITTTAHGFASGNSVIIAGSTIPEYNGTFVIDVVNAYTFRYKINALLASDITGGATASYQTVDGDLVLLLNQTNANENGMYYVNSGSVWEYFGDFYKYNGTENDNVAGYYGNLSDRKGNLLTHYRNGYSLKETADFLRSKLNEPIEFGKFVGSNRDIKDQGTFVRWLLDGRKLNIGKANDKEVIVDGFGLGNSNNIVRTERTWGATDPFNSAEVNNQRTLISRYKRTALWGLTNHHSRTLDGYNDKSPYVKDYPFIYNSKYDAGEVEPQLTGGHVDLTVDVERMRMSATGTSSTTDTNIRPIAIDTVWYHRENSYHNNITLDMTADNVFGKHTISLINNLDTPDFVGIYSQNFVASNITYGTSTYIELDDMSEFVEGDYIRFIFPMGVTIPSGLSSTVTYKIAVGYPSGNTIKIVNTDNSDVFTLDSGNGTFTIQRVAFDVYNDIEVSTALDELSSIVLNSGLVLCIKTVTGNVTKYYIKTREKRSLSSIAVKGSWTANTLSYDAAGVNGINIYLNDTETDYVTFTHLTKTTAELLSDLNYNNDLIPVPFVSTADTVFLTELFVSNSLIDYSDDIFKSEKIRSKKTFIHLPTSLDLKDGTPIEIDISLPIVPHTNSFPFNTVGSLSGYKNYVTQPRAYVFGGYQDIRCELIPVSGITSNGSIATVTTTNPHGIHTVSIDTDNISTSDDSIYMPNWTDIEVGDYLTIYTDDTLPTTSPQITSDVKYKVASITNGSIKLSTSTDVAITISSVGSGNQLITLCKPVKFNIDGSSASEYNKEFRGTIFTLTKIEFAVDETYSTSATNDNMYITKAVAVHGTTGVYGLTERYNTSLFGAMPEAEYASTDNIYHQKFTTDNIVGASYVDSTGTVQVDKRVLLATVYPTSTSTFQWRIDNDPQLRMLQWSMLNINAGGGSETTGSFANVTYKRNKAIFNEFNTLFKNGNDGLFSVYENPLSYISSLSPSFTQQQLNALIKIRLPETIGALMTTDDISTVGSFTYQANVAYIDLIKDFITSKVTVNTVKSSDEYIYILNELGGFILAEDETPFILENGSLDGSQVTNILSYVASLPENHGNSYVPKSFYDLDTNYEFLVFDSTVLPYSATSGVYAESRWDMKEIYVPSFIYNASGETKLNTTDVYHDMPSSLDLHMEDYFDVDVYKNNADFRYVVGDLNPSIYPSFAFGYPSTNKFIQFIEDTASYVDKTDVKRRFWDSFIEIPSPLQRQMQNAYYIDKYGATIEDTVKFHGANWIPFAKVFSTDYATPVNENITDISDYSSISAGGLYANINSTLVECLKSNPIATRFISTGYEDAFASVNSRETQTANEEFIRNYVAGYSNKLPFRFYNGNKIMVSGNVESIGYSTDLTNPEVATEIDAERIYRYSLRDYLNEYSESPSDDNGMYMDDNFLLLQSEIPEDQPGTETGLIDMTSMYTLIENGTITDNNGESTLVLCDWSTLDGWESQTGQLWTPAGTGYISDGKLYSIEQNPFYRYNTGVTDTFIVESFINPQDDQSLYFCSHRADPTMVNYFTARELSYFGLIFEEYPPDDSGICGIFAIVRHDDSPIMYDYDMTNSPERLIRHVGEYDNIRIATYTKGVTYRAIFARKATDTFMLKVYDTTDNSLVCEYTTRLKIPNANGYTTDDIDLLLCPGRQGGYFDRQSMAINIDASQVDEWFGDITANHEDVIVKDPNPSWWYFESGNPNTMPVASAIKSAITVSGMNYLADREFYLNKMQFNYTRIKMSFIFSELLGRWLPFDYRQAPTSYLTPTFGATALQQKEKSMVFTGRTGMYTEDYVPIEYTNSEGTVNTIENGTYPIDSNGNIVLDYLWKNTLCTESHSAFTQLSNIGYWEMPAMELNRFCYPFLSDELPYDSTGDLLEEMDYTHDVQGADIYRFTRLLEPNKESPVGINFVVPNNVFGGELYANNDLFVYQPHMWKVYWHMRPAVCAMDGTDIPTGEARTGGVMADPVLNNIFTYPNPRDPQFYIPWHEDMNTDWLNAGWLISDSRIRNDSNSDRDKYYEFDAE